MFLTRLGLAIQTSVDKGENSALTVPQLFSTKESSDNSENMMNKEEEEKMRHQIVKTLRNLEILLVLDNCEDPLEDD